MSSPSHAFVELKSFGDLVICSAALRQVDSLDLARCRLLIGPYLSDLCAVLAPACSVEILAIPDRNVPALFDVKKRGVIAALRSALTLRTALATAVPGAMFVTERQTLRERFIAGRRSAQAIPPAENVYLAFERYMARHFTPADQASQAPDPVPSRRVALCPFSRVAAKNIPGELIAHLVATCARAGFEPELLLLEGEHIDLPASVVPARIIPRRFDALANALVDRAAVISADSLPAHLAEYCATPAFVASPVENRYWLPKRAFQGDHWGLLTDRVQLVSRLQRFLDLERP